VSRVRLSDLAEADEADEAAFLAAVRASRALHSPWLNAASTPAAFQLLLDRAAREDFFSLLARRRDTGALVGYLNISNIVRGPFQSAFLGYGAFTGEAGRGYMTEALGLTLNYAFGPLKLHRLEANIQPGNARSIALAKRCGFVKEGFSERYLKVGGRWRDHERWAIRAEQWRRERSARARA
jgi:ribosomal-protein-alanine N-acetyltransferase